LLDVATETGDGGLATNAVGCRTVWVKRKQNAIAGTQQWAMTLQVHWCFASGIVTSIAQTPLVDCCGPFWFFNGWVTEAFGAAGSPSVRSFLQGQFRYSVLWFSGSKTPWIVITVHGDGSYELGWG